MDKKDLPIPTVSSNHIW